MYKRLLNLYLLFTNAVWGAVRKENCLTARREYYTVFAHKQQPTPDYHLAAVGDNSEAGYLMPERSGKHLHVAG